MSKRIDINCDVGEGFANDDELLKYVTSANVACGFHAGDATTMAHVARVASRRGINIGAHVSLPDRENFGRKRIAISPAEIENIVLEQIVALATIAGKISHVKAHGALYHMANEDKEVAAAIGRAAKTFGKLFWIAQGNTYQEAVARKLRIRFAREAFADRRYLRDGRLVPREQPGALIEKAEEAGKQAVTLAQEADTICIHGDTAGCVGIVRAVREALLKAGFRISPFK